VFCEECKEYIKRGGSDGDRCAICARFKSDDSKSIGISFFDDYGDGEGAEPAQVYPACDECRQKIVFGFRAESERYLDEQLPDSHVNVKHWESDGDE
jgi:hypothetical protein